MSASCNATITDWATLVTTTITINLTWWILDIPKLRNSKPIDFLDAVAWQCLRMCFPSVAAIYAIVSTPQHKLWPKRYYNGPQMDGQRENFDSFDLLKCSAVNTVSIVSVVLSILRLYNGPVNASGWNMSLWSFPSLPVTVYGLSIQFAASLQLRRRDTLILGSVFAISVGAGISYAISQSANPSFEIAIILYAVMAAPLVLLFPVIQLTLLILAITTLIRIGGVAVGALTKGAYFPFCPLKGPAFAVPYIVFGAVAGLLALYAWARFSEDVLEMSSLWMPKWLLRRPDVGAIQTNSTILEMDPQPSPLSSDLSPTAQRTNFSHNAIAM